jgi:hypothetical protein
MARPRKNIDRKDFESLLALQCTLEEVTAFFDHKLDGCSADTIERWCKRTYKESFADIAAKKRNLGKISLRRAQFELAKKNGAVAIFLGKNYLGQKDSIIETDEQTLQAVGEALVKIKRAAEQADNNE